MPKRSLSKAVTANSSNTSVTQLGDALKFAGPLAASLGISLKETTAAIGALGNAGIQGGSAGAGLQIFLSKLIKLTPEARSQFQAAGVDLEKISPITNDLATILDALADSAFGAGEAVEAFGARGLRTVLSLLKQRAAFDGLIDKLDEAGGQAEITAKRMDAQLGGAVKAVQSAFQGLTLTLGNLGITALLEGIIRGVTFVVRAIAGLISILTPGGIAGDIFAFALKSIGFALGFLLAAGGIPLLITAIASFITAAIGAKVATDGWFVSMARGSIAGFINIVRTGVFNLLSWAGAAKGATAATFTFNRAMLVGLNPLKLFGAGVAFVGTQLKRLALILITVAKRVAVALVAFVALNPVLAIIVATVGILTFAMVELRKEGFKTEQGMVSLTSIFLAVSESIGKFFTDIAEGEGILAGIAQFLIDAWQKVVDFFTSTKDFFLNFFGSIADIFIPDEILTRAAELQEEAEKANSTLERLSAGMSDTDKAAARLGQEFARVKSTLEGIVSAGDPVSKRLFENQKRIEAINIAMQATEVQFRQLGTTREKFIEALKEDSIQRQKALKPLSASIEGLRFENDQIGLNTLQVELNKIAREQALAVKRGEQQADAKGLALVQQEITLRAQLNAVQDVAADVRALAQERQLIGLIGRERAEIALQQKIANIEREEGVVVEGALLDLLTAQKDAQLAINEANFRRDISEQLADAEKQIALLGKTTEEVKRMEVAFKTLDAAKKAGLNPAEAEEFATKMVESFDRVRAAQDALQQDAGEGISRGFQKFIDESKDFAGQFESLTTNAISKVEDAFVKFVQTGKLDFKSLVASISADLLKIQVKGLLGNITEVLGLGKAAPESPAEVAKNANIIVKEAAVEAKKVVEEIGTGVGDTIELAGQKIEQALLELADKIRRIRLESPTP